MTVSRFSNIAVERARRAQRSYRRAEPGYYIRRVSTGIVFRGPCANWRDASDLIEVELADERPGNFEVVHLR